MKRKQDWKVMCSYICFFVAFISLVLFLSFPYWDGWYRW